jgi:hypothetical protein
VAAAIDYKRKVVTFGVGRVPSGDYEADLRLILEFVASHSSPRHADRLSKPISDLQGLPWTPRDRGKDE